MPLYTIEFIEFSSGERVSLRPGEILAIVGPNNSGKSAALRNIAASAEGQAAGPVVKQVVVKTVGSSEDLLTWVDKHTHRQEASPGAVYRLGWGAQRHDLKTWWEAGQVRPLAKLFVTLAGTENRLSAANRSSAPDLFASFPQSPMQVLYADEPVESRLDAIFAEAFGQHLTVNRVAGQNTGLHVGDAVRVLPGETERSKSFIEKLQKQPLLENQGDGMRSFVGALLVATVADWPVVLIDEPEAFLHPPQARLLGSTLVRAKSADSQLVIATHSGDVLRGMLNAGAQNLRIVRLVRDGQVNRIRELPPEYVKELWSDSILRFSNVLDGIFHEGVVVCEGDADCRFYSALVDVEQAAAKSRATNLMFAAAGSKSRIPTVCRGLVGLGVKTGVIADFDLLRDWVDLRKVVEAVGGDTASIEAEWKAINAALSAKAPPLTVAQLETKVAELLSRASGVVDRRLADRIREEIRFVDAWDTAKHAGKASVPSGGPSVAAESLLAMLRALGVFVVEVGEMEGFCRTAGNHGPRWLSEVLLRELGTDPELANARAFASAVVKWFGSGA